MADNMNSLAAGGIPNGLTPELFMKIKILFIESFQHIYTYAFVLTIIAFVLCFFLKKEVLSSKSEE